MTIDFNGADASLYYHESAAADVARIDSSALLGNLADAMKNAIVLFPIPEAIAPRPLASVREGEEIELEESV